MTDRCEIPRCRRDVEIGYLGHSVCLTHWTELTSDDALPDALRMALGIEAGPEVMMEDTNMSKKNEKPAKAAGKAKAAKTTPTSEPKEKVALRTVALRVPEAEFQLLHKAAGPRQLAAFMRTTLLAAANKTLAK